MGEDVRSETSKKHVQCDAKSSEFSPAFYFESCAELGDASRGLFGGIINPCFSQNSGEAASSV